MKIVYNIAGTFRSGGMERVLANKANWLASNGHEVIIVTTDQNYRPNFFSLNKKIQSYNLDINYESNNGKSFFNKLIHYPLKQKKHKKRLSYLLNELKPDITISMLCNDANIIPSIKDGSKKVAEIHFCHDKFLLYGRKGIWGIADKIRTTLIEKTVKKYDAFAVLSAEDALYWKGCKNLRIIPNARTFKNVSIAKVEKKRVVAIGRFEYQKGLDRLIKAWKIVHSVCSDWSLDLIGEGQEKQSLLQQINEFNLENSIHLLEPVKNVPKELLNSSILVLPSRYEGFGMVLVEAQSFGVPPISFSCKCGPSDIIENGKNGFLVPEGDIDELADSLIKLIQDEDLRKRMGKQAYLDSVKYDEDVVMKQWVNLFEELMNK